MAKRYTTDEVVAMMSAPSPNVEMLEQPASPFLDPAQINAAERELSQPPPEYPRPDTVGTAITDAAGMDRPATGSSGNMALQNFEAQEAFPIDQTPAPQRPAGGSQTLYPSAQETKPSLPKQRYTTDEVMSLYMQQSKPRYSTKDVMLKMVQPLDDPTMPRLGRDEYFKAKEIKRSLQESGDLPSNWEEAKAAVGGFLLTVPDAFATALYKTDKSQGWLEIGGAGFNPALALSETWRRSPATLAYSSEMARQGYAGMAEGLRVMGGPKYRVAESGEFVMDEEESAGGQFGQIDPRNIVDRYKAKGLTLRPVNDEDKKDFEYQQWNKKMDRDLQVERARTAEMPPEFAYRMLVGSAAAVSDYNTGRNDFANITGNVGPMQSQAVVGSMLVDPLTYTTFGAAASRIGISAAAKGATARSLDIIGRAVNKAVKPAEIPLTQIDRFRKIVMPPAKVAGAYGLATGAAYAADVMQLPPELKTAAYTAAGLYTAYRGGLGVLRFVGKRFPEASVILRESADPTNGLDLAARKVVASNPNVPGDVRARLERPSQFLSMESTPQRLSQNMALSPGTRKMMERLSNWYVVQGVRGASDVATGAVKGAIVAAPFAELTRLGGDERAADAMYGIGPALGAFGGAANRVFGARSRTIGRAESDIGRMLVDVQAGNTELRTKIGADGKAALQSWNFYNSEIGRMLTDVELAAGDVDALVKNRSFDELARIAAMQGFFRSKVDYIPLGAADFALNADQHGADGSAGFFLSVPDSERARIFVNVDARRADVEPHEFGEAFFSTGAFSPEQMAAMRSGVDARYGLDGVQKRANEYAESLIKASNATNFPNEKLVVSAEQIQAKVNELAQAELQRGGNDPLDWVRREIMVEEWRMAGMDFASIRRNIPEGANPVKFIEDVLGASARALGLSGVRVDPETGIPITPEQLFRENPVAADDPVVMSNLKAYTKAYRAWLNDPAHEVPSGVKIAPDGRAESLANNPSVIFDANGQNPLATRDPQTGQVRWKNDKDRAKDAKVRGQQIRNVAGRDLVAPGSPQFGPKKTANGRIRISGRRLPAALELQNHWKPQLDKIRRLEALADGDESTQVLYVAMGNSADKVKTSRPQDIVAINREMVFDEWVMQGKNNDLYGQFLDLTTIRNRAMRAISERNPALDPARGGPGYSLQAIMDDVYQWMADKRANKDGAATIGADRKNVVNALINPGTNLNREKNPIAGAFGRGSAIKTLLVDNIMAVSGTGRKGAAMDYNWANGNFMPDKPAPRPNMDGDLAPPRAIKDLSTDQILRELEENQGYLGPSTLGMREGRPVKGGAQQTRELLKRNTALDEELRRRGGTQEESDVERVLRQRGQAMPDITITPDEARRRGLVGPVYHGSPDFKGRKFDPKYRARSSGISRGGFSFSDDVASADGYASAPIDSAQAAVDSANDVMREAAGRMERGLKIKGFSAPDELPEFNVRYVDDISELSSYFNELAKDMPKDLATRLRDAAKQVNEPANPVVVEAYLRNPKTMDIDGKKLWLVDNPDDIFVSAARPPQGAETGGTRGQAMPDTSDIDTAKFTVAYRGGPSGKGDFPGTFVSTSQEAAAQYGDVRAVGVPRGLKVLSIDDDAALQLARQYEKRHPADALNDDLTAGESPTDLFMFPRSEWVKMLKQRGYQATQMGEDLFVFDGVKLSDKQARKVTREQAMPDADQPRRYVSMEKFIEEAGDDLGEVLPNAYRSIEFNDDDYPTHLVSFSDTRNSMYRSRVPSKEFFDWLHSDRVMDGLVFDKEYKPATAGEGASHTKESYQAVIDRLRKISLKPSKKKAQTPRPAEPAPAGLDDL